MPSYFIVFHAVLDANCGPVDIGDDPCFTNPPSWGICRPPTRKSIQVGTNLFFIGYVKPNKYFVKGWFQVGEKISYVEALNRFPNRTNVIISLLPNNQEIRVVIQNRQVEWRYPNKEQNFITSGLTAVPDFLFRTISGNQVFIQNPIDGHEIDNWKCNRIFHCTTKKFSECIANRKCLKEGDILLPKYHNYVIANKDNWVDIGYKFIPWETVEKIFQFNLSIRTPRGQHNVLCIPEDRTQELIDYFRVVKNDG